MKLVIFSVCLNEGDTIKKVFDDAPREIEGVNSIEKVVIDDGSTDNTVSEAEKAGAHVFRNINRKHIAYGHMRGIRKSLDLGADIAVHIDGDGQFKSEEITKLVGPIVKGEADFVSADRFTDSETGKSEKPQNMPSNKYYGNKLGAWLISALTGQKYPDVTCGFRAYSKKAMMALNISEAHTYTQESFLVLATKKINISFVPVDVTYFKGRKSRVVSSFIKYMSGSALNILRSFRDYAPLKFFGILGSIPFFPGLISGLLLLTYWMREGQFSPYKFVGFIAIYLVTLGMVIWLIGLMADMMDRNLKNQEKILEEVKQIRYNDGSEL